MLRSLLTLAICAVGAALNPLKVCHHKTCSKNGLAKRTLDIAHVLGGPEAAVQISALALKSANAVILKGGKEAANTNAALVAAIQARGRSFRFGAATPAATASTRTRGHPLQLSSPRATVTPLWWRRRGSCT